MKRTRFPRPSREADEDDLEEEREEQAREEEMERLLGDTTGVPQDWLLQVESRIERVKHAAQVRGTEDRKTLDEVFDKATLLTLWKFISNGVFSTLDYPVSTGKEANVFHATTAEGGSLAVKIFRTNTATFRAHRDYIEGDPRFGKIGRDRRDVVNVWTQKEFKNLQRYFEAGVRVPSPVGYRHNVLVMEFVGDDGTPAPLLKDAPPGDPAAAHDLLVETYRRGLHGAKLVHGDFSEFNVLHRDGDLVVIDVAQAVLSRHPMARELLARDARNLAKYFRRLGVATTPEETLGRITRPEAGDGGEEGDDDD